MLYPRRPDRWPLGKPSDQLIEKLLCTDLEMEGVSAVLHTYIEELDGVRYGRRTLLIGAYSWLREQIKCTHRQSQKSDILVSGVD